MNNSMASEGEEALELPKCEGEREERRKATENKGQTDQEVMASYVWQRMNIDGRKKRGFGRIGSMKYQDLTESYGCSEGFFFLQRV